MISKYTKTHLRILSVLRRDHDDADLSHLRRLHINNAAVALGEKVADYQDLLDDSKIAKGVYNLLEHANREDVAQFETPDVQVVHVPTKSGSSVPAPASTDGETTGGQLPEPPETSEDSTINNVGVSSVGAASVYVPDVDANYVRWGYHSFLTKVIKSRQFYPLYISGLSGNGKSVMVKQVCAQLKREYVRVQLAPETDEDDLIGGFRLINGETVFSKGPVINAMESGAVLLLDELDRATNKIMCLQGVLEGEPVLIKKTGQVIYPKPGFTVIATANTKGQGSEDGRFSAAGIIDEAFLERFTACLEQPYPTTATETKILSNHARSFGVKDDDFITILIKWAEGIRKTYLQGGCDDLISTRRLRHIIQSYSITQDRKVSVELAVARFNDENAKSFMELYTTVDASINTDGGDTTKADDNSDKETITLEKEPPF